MKKRKCSKLLLVLMLLLPSTVSASQYTDNIEVSSLINFNAVISTGAIINDNVNSGNFNIIIIGMIVIIIVLVGVTMFATKK